MLKGGFSRGVKVCRAGSSKHALGVTVSRGWVPRMRNRSDRSVFNVLVWKKKHGGRGKQTENTPGNVVHEADTAVHKLANVLGGRQTSSENIRCGKMVESSMISKPQYNWTVDIPS